jgi:hypothetical protein
VKKQHSNPSYKIDGQFVARRIEMLRSPAFRVLSLSGRRILDRIEIEHASHGGKDNGELPVTFANLKRFGIPNTHDIGHGIRELCVLGFVELTRPGRGGNGEFRTPNLFRLTYLPANGKRPTDEWQNIRTIEDAKQIVRKIRTPGTDSYPKPGTDSYPKTGHVFLPETPDSPGTDSYPLSRKDLAIYSPKGGIAQDHRHQREQRRARRRAHARAAFLNRTNAKGDSQ